jgi:inosose dehydratase
LERSNILQRSKRRRQSLHETDLMNPGRDTAIDARLRGRLAGAPISWGVCEVPGWGRQLDPDRVLAEMAALGITASELGPTGYLGDDPAIVRAALDRHGISLVAGFVPLVLHEPELDAVRAQAAAAAATLAAAGATHFLAAIVLDEAWSRPVPLDDAQWDRLVTHLEEIEDVVTHHGLTLAVHPHWDTLIETAADVERLLASSSVPWCMDSGHLALGGADPAAFVDAHGDRIVHVHLKDVDLAVSERLRAGDLTLVEAVQAGLFRPLGQGDAGIDGVVRRLDRRGYEGWLVLEQDTAITGDEPPVGSGPIIDVRASIEFLNTLALEEYT